MALITARKGWDNPLSAAVVLLCFLGLIAIAPSWDKEEAELRCDASGKTQATLPTMNACVEESRRRGACGCHSVENKWAKWYVFGVAPIITTALAFILLTGTLSRRLLWLNLAVGLAILAQFIWSLAIDPAAAMVVPLIPVFIAGFCAGTSVLFLVLYFGRRMVRRAASAT